METMLIATGINDQLQEEATTTGRRETPTTHTTASSMKEKDAVMMKTVTEVLHIFVLCCSGRGAGRG